MFLENINSKISYNFDTLYNAWKFYHFKSLDLRSMGHISSFYDAGFRAKESITMSCMNEQHYSPYN